MCKKPSNQASATKKTSSRCLDDIVKNIFKSNKTEHNYSLLLWIKYFCIEKNDGNFKALAKPLKAHDIWQIQKISFYQKQYLTKWWNSIDADAI